MNQVKPKSNEKIGTQPSSNVASGKHPVIKRKREDEPFQRMVMPKAAPSYDLQNKKLTTNKLPNFSKEATQATSTKRPIVEPEQELKKSFQNFAQNYKKNTTSRDLQPIDALKKKPTENSIFNKNAKPVLNVKKIAGGTKKEYENLLEEAKKFDAKADGLLTDLNSLVDELEDKTNPLLKKSEERLQELQKIAETLSGEHKQKVEELSEKIKTMRESRLALNNELSEKKKINASVLKTKTRHELDVELYNRSLAETRRNLDEVLRKNRDLNNFISSLEEAIKNTKARAKARCLDIFIEEKKMMIIEELIHMRKQHIRTFLLLRHNEAPQDKNSSYKISVNECRRRIKVETQENEEKKKSRFFDFEGIYSIDNYQQRDDELFQNQDQILYKNILSSIFETENKKNYFFILLAQDTFIRKLLKDFITTIVSEHGDPDAEISQLAEVQFDHAGKILSETVDHFSKFDINFTEENKDFKHTFYTFEAKLKAFSQPKRFSFMVISPDEVEFIDTLKNMVEKHKDKPDTMGGMIEGYPLGNQNILDFVKIIAPSSAHYSFLAVQTHGHYIENPESNQENCIELLQAFNRLRN